MINKKRLLITGSRAHTSPESVIRVLNKTYTQFAPYILVNGDCPDPTLTPDPILGLPNPLPESVDKIAQRWANLHGIQTEEHPADWEGYGRAAGPMRNKHMVNLGADICLAFPLSDSRGTFNCIKLASAAGIPVWIFTLLPDGKLRRKVV